jgi:hypothetical protein
MCEVYTHGEHLICFVYCKVSRSHKKILKNYLFKERIITYILLFKYF